MGPRGAPDDPTARALQQARRNYAAAIRSVIRSDGFANPELPGLEQQLVRTYYLEYSTGDASREREEQLYRLGRQSYRRMVVYRTVGPAAAVEFARALIELADWDLLFSHNGKALDGYAEAYDVLATAGLPNESIAALFAPEAPVLLPVFLPNPLATAASQNAAEHVDVAFELGRFGTTHKVEIVAASDSAASAAERDALRFLAGNRFRPHIIAGESGRSAPYNLRYYVSD
jgi:hypothetical protein